MDGTSKESQEPSGNILNLLVPRGSSGFKSSASPSRREGWLDLGQHSNVHKTQGNMKDNENKTMLGRERQNLWENRKSSCNFSSPVKLQARKLTAGDSFFLFPSCLFLRTLLRIYEEVNNSQFFFTVKIL